MIKQLTGTVVYKNINSLILNVHGVGYEINVTPTTLAKQYDKKTTLWTHLAVRENSLDLYGFSTQNDLEFFELLLSISGIGPKSALGILSVANPDTLKNAISTGDTSYLTKVSGIGKKSAGRIVMELKDKIQPSTADTNSMQEDTDTLEALVSMGYPATSVRNTLKTLPSEITNVKDRIKATLKLLSNNN